MSPVRRRDGSIQFRRNLADTSAARSSSVRSLLGEQPRKALHHGGHGGTILMLHEDITERIIGAAMKVHSALGAGCLESTYSACLCHQLSVDGLHFEHQVPLPVIYQGIRLDAGYRIDFLVEDC